MPHGSADRRARRHSQWQAGAQHRGGVARLLWPVSLLYRVLVTLRNQLYASGVFKTHHLPVPVIVVGNVVVGGAGKTPTVIALVQHLQTLGWRPGVISRGFGRQSKDVVEVSSDTPRHLSGDEPALIQRATGAPVCVARRRMDAGYALLTTHPEINVLLSDDGLQHHALGRDLSVAVFDERGVGNGWLLPAGLLREPWPPARHASNAPDLVLRHAREDIKPAELPAATHIPVFDARRRLADHAVNDRGESIALAELQDLPLTAVAGIAQPAVFFEMLRARGLVVEHEIPMPDHADAATYVELLRDAARTLVCTEKDAVKLFELIASRGPGASPSVWAVPLEILPDPAFFAAIEERLASLQSGP